MPKAVRFDHYGGVDVLNVVEVERPHGPGRAGWSCVWSPPGPTPARSTSAKASWPSSSRRTFPRARGRTSPGSSRSSARAWSEGAVLPLFPRIAAYESYIYRLLNPKESRGVPGTFDRDLTVTGVNNGEQPETGDSGSWLIKAVF